MRIAVIIPQKSWKPIEAIAKASGSNALATISDPWKISKVLGEVIGGMDR